MASYDDTATVSGSVVSIDNGADEVPCKSVKVALPASLDGYNSASVVNSGKNMLSSAEADTKTNNSVNVTCDGNGKYTATGTATGGSANITFTLKTPCEIKSGMYLHLMSSPANANVSLTIQRQDNTSIYSPTLSPANRIIDLSSYVGETIYSIRLYVVNNASSDLTFSPMLSYSNTATTFVPYIAPTTYSASLGRTVYGAEVDIVNGTGKELVKKITVSAFTGTFGAVNNGYAYYISVVNTTHNTSVVNPTMMVANQLFTYGSIGRVNAPTWQYGGNDGANTVHIFILPSEYDTLTKANNFLSSLETPLEVTLTLATPTDFAFPGQTIETKLGANNFWSEQGDTELTYYKSGYGFTSVTVHKETPEGEPVVQTVKFHRIVYGGTADVVRGTCEPKNILLPSNTDSASTVVNGVARSYSLDSQTWTLEGTNEKTDANWLIYNGANFVVSKALVVGDTYTYSHTLSDNCYSQFTYKDTNGTTRAIGYLVGNTNKNASVTFTIPSNFVELLRFQIGVVKTATSVSEEAVFQLEKASSKTEYAPHFDPFTFPPISISTDQGENTFFANEGDSSITYRKAVD